MCISLPQPEPGLSTQDIVERIATTTNTAEIRSLIRFPLPFAATPRGLLVVIDCPDEQLRAAYRGIGLQVLKCFSVFCLQPRNLYQLSLPSRCWGQLGLPTWIREAGDLLFGADVRPLIRDYDKDAHLLANHLEGLASSRTQILHLLARRDYPKTLAYIKVHRDLLMYSALLEAKVWRVFPHTVRAEFLSRYNDIELIENIDRFEGITHGSRQADRESAFESVWLLERLMQRLKAFAK